MVNERLRAQRVQPGVGTGTQKLSVAFVFACERAGFLRGLGADAFAIDIGAKCDIAELGKHFGAFLFVIGQTHPLMDDEHARVICWNLFQNSFAIAANFFFQGGNLCLGSVHRNLEARQQSLGTVINFLV